MTDDQNVLIVLGTNALNALDYLKSLQPIDRLMENYRILKTTEIAAALSYYQEQAVSWKGRVNDIVLDEKSGRVRLGTLGDLDEGVLSSPLRLQSARYQLFCGYDRTWGTGVSLESMESEYEHMYKSLQAWKNDPTGETVAAVLEGLTWASPYDSFDAEVVNSTVPGLAVGDIGYIAMTEEGTQTWQLAPSLSSS
ncbi:hypothetical protein SISNIDRAFT_488019 [Sistotremastrum niveocremeum HHB9708]|uniref:Uncharacterized protein n=1 Tax=Sistotremastrum niveocremeum HHB9708 TaxID=1314777 RepID=A0A164RN85_9AGAM|nr:hypothetical protein SISNIDRAFT_488019 [Sistotremastrum niveocremeum HHB9708]